MIYIYIYVRYLRYVMVDRCYRSLLLVRREGSIVVDRMIWRIELQAYLVVGIKVEYDNSFLSSNGRNRLFRVILKIEL